ncbi:MAG: hypothetical protein JSV57_00555 [Candidatus Bathyarchaeota archaeon]|nr:MAG: hypothetical protein JSV57_00555 [Candidatus Bathyarchaeota archaeon]
MRKRSSLEIIAQILSLCKEPQIKTRVMYGTNLSWRMIEKYLPLLQSTGLLEVHHSPAKYVITPKGLEFLKRWKELTKLL